MKLSDETVSVLKNYSTILKQKIADISHDSYLVELKNTLWNTLKESANILADFIEYSFQPVVVSIESTG